MSIQLLKERLAGISAINVTPFKADKQEIDEVALRNNINHLVENDFKVIVPCGNTGEFYSLTLAECEQVTKIALEEMEGKASGLVGVGYDSKTAIKQSLYAQEHGAHGVMIHQPVHPHITENGLIKYYSEIANAIDIGVVLYITSKKLTVEGYKELAKIKNIVGIKYSVKEPFLFAELMGQLTDWDIVWVCGQAESWAPFYFLSGARGFTSGLVNVAPKKSQEMLNALQTNDYEKTFEIWNEIKAFEDLRAKNGDGNNVAVVKAAMQMTGTNVGEVRPPVNTLNEEDMETLNGILKSWGFV